MSTAERAFSGYVDNFLRPLCNANIDDRELVGFLDGQLVEWYIEAERPGGEPYAPMVVEALEHILDAIDGGHITLAA